MDPNVYKQDSLRDREFGDSGRQNNERGEEDELIQTKGSTYTKNR